VQEGSASMCSGLISLAKFRVVDRHWLLGCYTAGRTLSLRYCEQTHHRQVRTPQSDSPAGSGAPLSYTCSHSSTTRRVDKQRLWTECTPTQYGIMIMWHPHNHHIHVRQVYRRAGAQPWLQILDWTLDWTMDLTNQTSIIENLIWAASHWHAATL